MSVDTAPFWAANQPGFRFTDAEPGTPEFFEAVRAHRYALEPHIPEVVRFEAWRDADVLDAGCGIATDGQRFAEAGARYTGLDASGEALALARRRFELAGLDGSFVRASVTELPFGDESFDLVYSHGVIHHVPDTRGAVDEFFRVLRPGGTAVVMVYHRRSFNYLFSILVLRRVLAGLLLVPGATRWIARITKERPEVLRGHRELLRTHRRRYLLDTQLFLSNNTDGPGNPLSKVYDRGEVARLLAAFADIRFEVRYLGLRIYPFGDRIAASRIGRRLERRIGWHLYVVATKPA